MEVIQLIDSYSIIVATDLSQACLSDAEPARITLLIYCGDDVGCGYDGLIRIQVSEC